MSAIASHARPVPPSKTGKTVGLVLGAALVVGCMIVVEARWSALIDAPAQIVNYLGLMSRGVFANPVADPQLGYWQRAVSLMIESIHMAWIGTVIGALFSLPCGFLAAENVSPKPVVFLTRQILNGIRAIPELVWAIIVMLPIFGLGPVAGTMALGINSIGTLGKLTSEVIEASDPGPVEAARASGARPLQILRSSTIPQVMPEVVAFWLYRFEINIRAGAVLGVLGAGGIGSILSDVIGRRLWDRVGITLMAVILITILVDVVSSRLRARIIGGSTRTGEIPEAAAAAAI
ncbi:MAG TPA: phosphonate ABC transporter, permease protein PhnE [Euzebya sp.]|nr:phosphonate ABC transporter, permease protein PhnE [Euzebya sp.]